MSINNYHNKCNKDNDVQWWMLWKYKINMSPYYIFNSNFILGKSKCHSKLGTESI